MSTEVSATLERKAEINRGNAVDGAITSVWLAQQSSALFQAFAAHCHTLAIGAREGLQIGTYYHELAQLSGVELAKRGLTRQSIARVALTSQAEPRGVRIIQMDDANDVGSSGRVLNDSERAERNRVGGICMEVGQ